MEAQEPALYPPSPPATGEPPSSGHLFVANSDDPFPSGQLLANTEEQHCNTNCNSTDVGSLPVTEVDVVSSDAACLSHALLDKIVRQVEYYFSDENLPIDGFLLKQVRKDKDGYVPIKLISSFKKMKKLTKYPSLIVSALRTSSLLVVSSDGKKVKRLHPLLTIEQRTVVVENLPEDYSEDNIQKIFSAAGSVIGVIICKPHAGERSISRKKAHLLISSKLHALVKYDSVESAESAVKTLNDEMNWRNGMQVQVLSKRMEKYVHVQKRSKQTILEKVSDTKTLEIQDGLDKKDEDNGNINKGGLSRYKCRNSLGHGNTAGTEGLITKPIVEPRMPDGTRGFTMGRGKPIAT